MAKTVEVDAIEVQAMDAYLFSSESTQNTGKTAQVSAPEKVIVRESSLAIKMTNLPAEVDAFIGRSDTLEALGLRIEQGARLITILGAGGTGRHDSASVSAPISETGSPAAPGSVISARPVRRAT